jgi:glutamate-5-semialdehyde dehydrogenase
MSTLQEQCVLAKKASRSLRTLSNEQRNAVLMDFAQNLLSDQNAILNENKKDLMEATDLSQAMQDRLRLTPARIQAIAEGIQQVALLPDPLHQILEERTLSSGIHLQKITVPLGVIGIIFESRPNVSADCTALCFKAGSACVLKGGKEAYRSCYAIVEQMKKALL